jgi:hypothetical protein
MKIKNILLACLLVGCTTKTTTEAPEITYTDSLIAVSDSVMASAECSSKTLDSVTTATAEKVKDNVKVLTNTITNYETKIKAATKTITVEKVIRDTVYIETKKSFWGKTRKSITTSSDSTVGQSEVVDTTQQ